MFRDSNFGGGGAMEQLSAVPLYSHSVLKADRDSFVGSSVNFAREKGHHEIPTFWVRTG